MPRKKPEEHADELDATRLNLHEIRASKLLSAEEERHYARAARNGDTSAIHTW